MAGTGACPDSLDIRDKIVVVVAAAPVESVAAVGVGKRSPSLVRF